MNRKWDHGRIGDRVGCGKLNVGSKSGKEGCQEQVSCIQSVSLRDVEQWNGDEIVVKRRNVNAFASISAIVKI